MAWLTPLSDDEMNDEQTKAFKRALSKLGFDAAPEAPAWLRVIARSPEFLKDTYMNLTKHVFNEGALKPGSKATLAAVAAVHAGNPELAEYFRGHALAEGFSDAQITEALAIGATSTSFNYYFKFRSLAATPDFNGFRPGLRATLFTHPALGKAFAELINLMVSTANGCPSCVSGHVQEAEEYDVSKEQIDEAIRTGAIVRAMCMFLGTAQY